MFVLSMVYGAILRQGGYLPALTASVAEEPQGIEAATGRGLALGLGATCHRDQSACLAAAMKLGSALAPAVAGLGRPPR